MVSRPYYALHQILSGQYTPGGEFITAQGADYTGGYHVLPNNQIFSGFRPSDKSFELYIKRFDLTEDVKTYNKIAGITNSNYVHPILKIINPNIDDYELGYFYRYFVQKRNNPINSIMEIDFDQFQSINVRNEKGINGVIWNSASIQWKISGANAEYFNKLAIEKAEKAFKFIYLGGYLTNLKEFYR